MSDNETQDTEKLEDLSIQALRKFAALYRITLPRDATKDQIVEIIKEKQNSQDLARVVGPESNGMPGPGWARINIHTDPSPGASNQPVYVNCNGYVVTVPRGVDVEVPIKIIATLNDAAEKRLVENFQEPIESAKRWEYRTVLSYPFSVVAVTPGADPKPGAEAAKKAAHAPREKFRQLFGRWPRGNEVLEAQKEGFIKLSLVNE